MEKGAPGRELMIPPPQDLMHLPQPCASSRREATAAACTSRALGKAAGVDNAAQTTDCRVNDGLHQGGRSHGDALAQDAGGAWSISWCDPSSRRQRGEALQPGTPHM